jgi:hypothetical protein
MDWVKACFVIVFITCMTIGIIYTPNFGQKTTIRESIRELRDLNWTYHDNDQNVEAKQNHIGLFGYTGLVTTRKGKVIKLFRSEDDEHLFLTVDGVRIHLNWKEVSFLDNFYNYKSQKLLQETTNNLLERTMR